MVLGQLRVMSLCKHCRIFLPGTLLWPVCIGFLFSGWSHEVVRVLSLFKERKRHWLSIKYSYSNLISQVNILPVSGVNGTKIKISSDSFLILNFSFNSSLFTLLTRWKRLSHPSLLRNSLADASPAKNQPPCLWELPLALPVFHSIVIGWGGGRNTQVQGVLNFQKKYLNDIQFVIYSDGK